MKRAFDFLGSALGLFIVWPVILVLIIAVRRGSPGPGIFSQDRVGWREKPFRCHKLRTMSWGSPSVPTHEALASSVTPFGRFLRKTKLDELPQLWNVLCGEMSFVGPRPCLPSQAALIDERGRRGVFELRPGITGLAQVQGIDMSDPVKLAETDAIYLTSRSIWLDMRIILRTLFGTAAFGDRLPGC